MNDLIVIGGGPAGVTAALRARELGANVTLVEKERLGGTCTNDGCVPTRAWARAARLRREAEQFAHFGLVGHLPELDFPKLLTRTQQVVYQIHEKKQLLSHLESAGVKVHLHAGKARFSDANTLQTESGLSLQAEGFILCAGGHARQPSFPGNEHVLTHQDIWTLNKLPASIVIAGAGATGCQVASILNTFGVRVFLLEMHPTILGVEDEQVSQSMSQAMSARGIQVITGLSSMDSVARTSEGLLVTYQQEGETQQITSEAVLLASGWPGNADDLNLAVAGVETNRGYVVVNDHLQTTARHIFAAGDITGRMMLVQSAGVEARVAAENAVMGPGERFSHHIVPHGGFTDPEYASVGRTEVQVKASGEEYLVSTIAYADMDRAVIDGRTEGFLKLIVSKESHRVLGAHIVGEQAVEIIQILAVSMVGDMLVEQLAEMEFSYPTNTAIVGLAARRAVYELGVMPLAPQWRALGKSLAAEWERREP